MGPRCRARWGERVKNRSSLIGGGRREERLRRFEAAKNGGIVVLELGELVVESGSPEGDCGGAARGCGDGVEQLRFCCVQVVATNRQGARISPVSLSSDEQNGGYILGTQKQ